MLEFHLSLDRPPPPPPKSHQVVNLTRRDLARDLVIQNQALLIEKNSLRASQNGLGSDRALVALEIDAESEIVAW